MELTVGPGIQTVGTLDGLIDWIETPGLSPWRCGVAGVGVLDMTRVAPAMRKSGLVHCQPKE